MLGTVIRKLREKQGLTRPELAEAADVGVATIARLELYDQLNALDRLDRIAGALGTTAGKVLVSADRHTATAAKKAASRK